MGTRIKSYKTIYDDSTKERANIRLIQIAEITGNPKGITKGLHVLIEDKLKPYMKKMRFTFYTPSYKGLRAMIDGMVEIYGKTEVERELNIKIKE